MRFLIYFMILAGSALMVYNIMRYGAFLKSDLALRQNRLSGLTAIPLLLLIFFLVGYLAVGVSGLANLLMASILLGGSIFVFMLLTVMYSIIRHIRDTDQVLSNRYEEMREELEAMTRDSLAVFLINLTRDEVEYRAGAYLYDSDYEHDSYSGLLSARAVNVLDASYAGAQRSPFRREELLQRYQEGETSVTERLLVRRRDGETGYVRLEANLSKMPVTGDVVAFIVVRPCNEELARKTLLETVLMDEYDRIAYLIDGNLRTLISNAGKKKSLLLPNDEDDTYESVYLNYILPAVPRDEEKAPGPNPLRLSVIDKALEKNPVYHVNAPFLIEGEKRWKEIVFYCIDRAAKFYLMLIADSTQLQEEQQAQNRRLSDALAEAVRAGEARSRFFSRVSHDLHVPLDGILSCAEHAGEAADLAEAKACAAKVSASGRSLLSLMDDLFDMSRIDGGELQPEEAPLDLRDLAEELGTWFAALRPEKELRFLADTGGLREPAVLCDRRLLHRVLARLLENASVFAPEKGTVRLTFSQEEGGGPEKCGYLFFIRNDGMRIPEGKLARIFEAEAWEEGEKNAELPGVGLGMTVAKAFVDAMGGTVTAASDENGEAQFVIRFELKPLPAPPEEAAASEEAAEERAYRVLLADDNEINREIGELMLSEEGWTVDLAADGAEAVEKLTAAGPGAYDFILMDVQMPVMNGYEATAAIRALPDPALAAIPIIALTANAFQEDANAALAAGMNGHAVKPLDPAAIRRLISGILSAG